MPDINPRSIILLFQLSFGCLGALAISRINRKYIKFVIWSIFVLVILQYIWLVLQVNNKDPFFYLLTNPAVDDIVGFSASPDQMGTFFALTLPVMLYVHPLLGLLSIAGIFFSKSAFAFIAGISGGLFYLSFVSKKIFIFGLITALLAGLVYFYKVDKLKSADFETRGEVWRYAIESTLRGQVRIEKNGFSSVIKTNPWLGYGFGKFLTIFPFVPQGNNNFNTATEKFTHAHNDFVEMFFELGKIGLIILLLLIGNFAWQFTRTEKSRELVLWFSCILSYLLNACGNFLSHIAVSGLFLIIFYGMYKRTLNTNGKTSINC